MFRKLFIAVVSMKDPHNNYLLEFFRKVGEKMLQTAHPTGTTPERAECLASNLVFVDSSGGA
jgi:hypothetical protein